MSGTLPTWLEQWLGLATPGAGEGTLWRLTYVWRWPSWLTLLAAAAAVAWIAWCYARETGVSHRWRVSLAALRIVSLAIVVLMLAQVSISLERTGLPTVAVLVDRSASMGTVDRYDDAKLQALIGQRLKRLGQSEPTRLNLAKSLLLDRDTRLLDRLADRYQLKVFALADTVELLDAPSDKLAEPVRALAADGSATRLGAGLRTVLAQLRGASPAAVVVLSDGITTDGESLSEAARYAWRKGVPLYPVALGSERPVRDIELSDLLVDDVVFVDDVVDFQFKLSGTDVAGRQVEVSLRATGNDEVLASTKVALAADGQPQHVHLPYRPPAEGEFEYVVAAAPLDDEPNPANNRLARTVAVRKQQIRVLLVQGGPSYEFRYLKNLLARDHTIELHTVLAEADLEYAEVDAHALRVFPVRRDDLFAYDVLVFGDVNPAALSAATHENVFEFVAKRGGGIVLIAGPRYLPLAYADSPLAKLLPLELSAAAVDLPPAVAEGFRPQPTELGLTSPQMQLGAAGEDAARIWQNLPPLYWLLSAPRKPTAVVLAEHPSLWGADGRQVPVISQQFVGAGKVLLHATDETWRWRFRVGDVFFARYWVQAIRYLARSKGAERTAELAVERNRYRRGDAVRLRVRFRDERLAPPEDDGVSLVVERPGRANETVKLARNATHRGVFEATLAGVGDGPYHAWLASPSLPGDAPAVDFVVLPPEGETARLQTDLADLRQAVDESKGKLYRFADAGRLLDDLPPGRPVPIEPLPPWVIWNRWWLLTALLVSLCAEWLLRKRKGLL